MGNTIVACGMIFIAHATTVAKVVYNKIDETLDFFSVYFCPEKPSYLLVTDNLDLPAEDLSNFIDLFDEIIRKASGLLIMPLKMINDKKFAIHVYEMSSTFITQNVSHPQNIVTVCEKMLMYIAQNKNKIIEPSNKRVIKTVNLHGFDYDIPVNFWYTFDVDGVHKVFFFAHVSSMENYKGIIIAVDKNIEANHSLLIKMKQSGLDYYDQTLGINTTHSVNKQMDFI